MNTCDITTLLESPSLGQSDSSNQNVKKTEKKQKVVNKKNSSEEGEDSIDLDALDLGLSRRRRL